MKFWRTQEKLPWLFRLLMKITKQIPSTNTYILIVFIDILRKKKKSPNSKGFFPLKFWNVQSEPKKTLRMRRSEKDSLSKLWHTNVPSLFTISFFPLYKSPFYQWLPKSCKISYLLKLPKLKRIPGSSPH